MEVYDHCYHQLVAVLQEMDYCISAEDMSDAEREKLQKLYDLVSDAVWNPET